MAALKKHKVLLLLIRIIPFLSGSRHAPNPFLTRSWQDKDGDECVWIGADWSKIRCGKTRRIVSTDPGRNYRLGHAPCQCGRQQLEGFWHSARALSHQDRITNPVSLSPDSPQKLGCCPRSRFGTCDTTSPNILVNSVCASPVKVREFLAEIVHQDEIVLHQEMPRTGRIKVL